MGGTPQPAAKGLPDMDLSNPNMAFGNLSLMIRRRRRELGLTQGQVARKAGLSVGFISQLERGQATPSLASMVAIAEALKQPPGHFLDQPLTTEPFTRARERKRFAVGEGRTGVEYERLSATFPGSLLNAIVIHVPAGYVSETQSHKGEELFYVLQGNMDCTVDGALHRLRRGDSIHYSSTKPHNYANSSGALAVVLWVGTLGLFG
jgi:transcriptional regulator with XRE-family HTH domain